MTGTSPRYTLRDLPLAAKLVLSTFLISVGVGYFSALVQIHMQHSDRDGSPMPSADNVVAIFAGKKKVVKGEPTERVVSKLEALISGEPHAKLSSKNMTPAFFGEDQADYDKQKKEKPDRAKQLDAERHGERLSVIAWVNAPPDAREKAYVEDTFKLPADLAKQPVTKGYVAEPGVVSIKSIVSARCAFCHKAGGEKSDVPLTNYDQLAELMPKAPAAESADGWIDSGKQMDLVKLTQSTHAHLLSFAMLFALTGMAFAFTSYPGVVRGVLGPLVLMAQFADVACWWLARLDPPYGPLFALCILGTGGVVGLGLAAQIVLSLFNMYGPKGKAVLVLLFAVAAGGGVALYVTVITDHLNRERDKAKAKADAAKTNGNGTAKSGQEPPKAAGPGCFEALITGKYEKGGSWSGKSWGGMVRAFFNKEDDFKAAEKGDDPELPKLKAEREGEQAGMLAWAQAADDVRKKAYEEDNFALPEALVGKPLTRNFLADDKTLKVKSLIDARCAVCHGKEGTKEDVPLDNFDLVLKSLLADPPEKKEKAAAPPADPPAVAAAPTPIPAADE